MHMIGTIALGISVAADAAGDQDHGGKGAARTFSNSLSFSLSVSYFV